jgi:GT2 family glycosyltransferase
MVNTQMIGLITVNYNQYQQTKEFLESLNSVQKAKNAWVYIADVSSKKEVITLKGYQFPVTLEEKENKGYAFGVNGGLNFFLAKGIKKFCVVNNDILFAKDFLITVEKTFKKADIFGGKIYYAKGFEYHKERYQKKDLGKVLWYAGGGFDWKNALTFHRGVDEVDQGQYDNFEEIDFITGCLFCFNKKVVDKVGFWDERYFLYFEDADYCVRVKKEGFKLYYNPKIVIWHKNAQSTGGAGSKVHQRYQRKNRLIFGLKYAPFKTKIYLILNYLLGK